MVELGGLARDARRLEEAEFAQLHPLCVLLIDKSEFGNEPGRVSFETVAIPTGSQVGPQGYVVFGIEKNEDNPWPDRISFGRARSCDIVVRHASVSKLHGHFVIQDEGFALSDAKSTNGCKVNDQTVQPRERAPLSCGDVLCLGLINATFYTPAGLHRFLRTLGNEP